MNRFEFADDVCAVLFDAGNTLICIDHALLAAALATAGIDVAVADVRVAEMRLRPRIDPYLATVARRESREVVEASAGLLLDLLGVEPGTELAAAGRAAYAAAWPTLWTHVTADVRPALEALRARGFPLAVVSNSTGRARSLLAQAGLLDALEFVIDSHEVGVEKPDPRIFEIAAERLAVPPASCVYLGDLYSIDVAGSRAAGMHGVLLDPIGAWGDVASPRVASLAELVARL